MARIRTIKPEFPQSESMGKISRDARLLFVQLWTIADDSGRLRAVSRMLASLLFPYDDDAPGLIDGWLAELESVDCIVRYKHDGQTYLEICNWLQHQKIDRPTESKIPQFDESSRILANNLESSSLERKGKEGKGREASPTVVATKKPIKHKRGQFQNVLLTDEEYTRLSEKYQTDLPDMISHLSEYIKRTGKAASQDHNLVLQKWVLSAVLRERQEGKSTHTSIENLPDLPPELAQELTNGRK